MFPDDARAHRVNRGAVLGYRHHVRFARHDAAAGEVHGGRFWRARLQRDPLVQRRRPAGTRFTPTVKVPSLFFF